MRAAAMSALKNLRKKIFYPGLLYEDNENYEDYDRFSVWLLLIFLQGTRVLPRQSSLRIFPVCKTYLDNLPLMFLPRLVPIVS